MGLLYQVDDNCPLLWMIFMSRNGMDPFSSLSMVNFRDGCKLLLDIHKQILYPIDTKHCIIYIIILHVTVTFSCL